LTKYGTIEDNPARLHAYSGSSIGCMELHDLQVEEYTGTNRGSHNGSRLLGDLKPQGQCEGDAECFKQVAKGSS